jgi:hypothetical protein
LCNRSLHVAGTGSRALFSIATRAPESYPVANAFPNDGNSLIGRTLQRKGTVGGICRIRRERQFRVTERLISVSHWLLSLASVRFRPTGSKKSVRSSLKRSTPIRRRPHLARRTSPGRSCFRLRPEAGVPRVRLGNSGVAWDSVL